MLKYLRIIAVAFAMLSATTRAEVSIPEQSPYPLPAEVQQSLATLASECDVLVRGETHGTWHAGSVAPNFFAKPGDDGRGIYNCSRW